MWFYIYTRSHRTDTHLSMEHCDLASRSKCPTECASIFYLYFYLLNKSNDTILVIRSRRWCHRNLLGWSDDVSNYVRRTFLVKVWSKLIIRLLMVASRLRMRNNRLFYWICLRSFVYFVFFFCVVSTFGTFFLRQYSQIGLPFDLATVGSVFFSAQFMLYNLCICYFLVQALQYLALGDVQTPHFFLKNMGPMQCRRRVIRVD